MTFCADCPPSSFALRSQTSILQAEPQNSEPRRRPICAYPAGSQNLQVLCKMPSSIFPFSSHLSSLLIAAQTPTTARHYVFIFLRLNYPTCSVKPHTARFCTGGDSKFGFLCDTVTMWCITVPLGMLAAFVLKLPVPVVYLIVNLDEMIKLPAVYRHYKKYKWIKDLTVKGEMQNE